MNRRKIHLPNGVWEYHISSRHTVVIWSPDGKKHIADTPKLTGRDWETLARGKWKRTPDATILPSEVKYYIQNELIGVGNAR